MVRYSCEEGIKGNTKGAHTGKWPLATGHHRKATSSRTRPAGAPHSSPSYEVIHEMLPVRALLLRGCACT